jgi:N-methylhydantoinase A/oxoprolinase/acetone carboxylase beta subunit
MIRIGVDVGGANTDAVVRDDRCHSDAGRRAGSFESISRNNCTSSVKRSHLGLALELV